MISDVFQSYNILFLLEGLKITLEIGVGSIICSVIFGTVLGVSCHLKIPVLGQISTIYIDIIRNLPVCFWYWWSGF